VFCIELVSLNVESGKDGEKGAQVSDGPPAEGSGENEGPEEAGAERPGDTEQAGAAEQPGDGEPPGEQSQPPEGKLYSLPLHDDVHELALYINEDLFKYNEGGDGWWFTYIEDGETRLQIVTDLITPPGGITKLMETLLSPYLNGGESLVGGSSKIAESSLRGIYAIGEKGNETYEGWVIRLTDDSDSDKAVDIIINYQNEEQKNALYDILDTLELNVLETEMETEEEQ